MYRKYKSKEDGGNFRKKEGLNVEIKRFSASAPTKEKIQSKSEFFDYKAFRDLAFHGAIEVKADPNTEIARGSYPYAILNSTNRVIEGKYPGYDNLTGNSIVRLQNSNSSLFLNLFDSVCMVKRLNYNYMAILDDVYDTSTTPPTLLIAKDQNCAYNIEMVKAFDQALSYGYSTMLTQLPFYADYCKSYLPRIGSYIGSANDSYDRMGCLVHYQTVLQNLVSPLAKYTEIMSLEQDLLNMTYRRESPLMTELFGQFKKKAFIAQLNAIGTTVIGEYFDYSWWQQMNALRHIPSRKANDMNNPIITMVSTHAIPRIQLYATADGSGTAYYDSDSKLIESSVTLLDPEDFTRKTYSTITLEEAALNINKLLDAHYILEFVRNKNSGTLPSGSISNTSEYYEDVVRYCRVINSIAGRFVSNMTEIRTFLDKLNDTGMVYWKKGVAFDIGFVKPVALTYNQIIADVLKNTLAGAHVMTFDSNTQRWACDTEWNMYTGVNEYDKKSGGAFLTMSLRVLNTVDNLGNTIDPTSSIWLVPILFSNKPLIDFPTADTNHVAAGVRTINRLGYKTWVQSYVFTAGSIWTDQIVCRLNPLNNAALSIKAPNWYIDSGLTSTERAHCISMLHKLFLQIAGYDRIKPTASTVSSMTDPDLLCFIDLQLEDVSNAMIQYARNYSPFRVNTPDGARTMGFGR